MDKDDIGKKCENCRFFRPDPANIQQGYCRINPPVVFPMQTNSGGVAWGSNQPSTSRDAWCGSHEVAILLH